MKGRNGWDKGDDDQPVQQFNVGQVKTGPVGPFPPADPELETMLRNYAKTTSGQYTTFKETQPVKADKNTPESLRQLRWAIYEVIESYEGDYGKTISGCLKQEVERLFQEYTHS